MQDPNRLSIAIFDRYALAYQERFMDVSRYGALLDRLCAELPDDASVLDVACGPGNLACYLLQQKPRLQLEGIDLAPKMIELAQANNPQARFYVHDGRALHSLGRNYQAIVCGFAFPYWNPDEAAQWIADAAACLVADGWLYLSTEEGDPALSGLRTNSAGDPVYFYYYTDDFLIKELERQGFAIIKKDRQTHNINGVSIQDWIVLAQKKRYTALIKHCVP